MASGVQAEQELEGGDAGRHQREVGALAHIEAPRARLVALLVVDEPGEILGARAGDPALLERQALLALRGHVEIAQAVGAQEPLVAAADEEVGADFCHVEGQGAQRLGDVEDERRADGPAALADAGEVEEPAVGPAAMGQGGDGHPLVQGRQHGRGEVAVLRRPRR